METTVEPDCDTGRVLELLEWSGLRTSSPRAYAFVQRLASEEAQLIVDPDSPPSLPIAAAEPHLEALWAIQLAARAEERRPDDERGGLVDRFSTFLTLLGRDHPETVRWLRAESDSCHLALGRPGAGQVCTVAKHVPDMMRDPREWTYDLLNTALIRASFVESVQEGKPYFRTMLVPFFGANYARSRDYSGWCPTESTVPYVGLNVYKGDTYRRSIQGRQWALRYLAPYEVRLGVIGRDIREVDLDFRLLSRRLTPNLVASLAPQIRWQTVQAPGRSTEAEGGAGLRLALHHDGLHLLGGGVHVAASQSFYPPDGFGRSTTVRIGADLSLLHFLQFGVDYPVARPEYVPDHLRITVGLRDANGLAYWAYRAVSRR